MSLILSRIRIIHTLFLVRTSFVYRAFLLLNAPSIIAKIEYYRLTIQNTVLVKINMIGIRHQSIKQSL